MGYFDNLENGLLNKYKKNLKNEKKKLMKLHEICNGSNLTIFDGLPNNNEIV
jgi:hypothetical protein